MRYIAFLRAINVGGHNVTMAELRKLFGGMGFRNVETFIASGNVIFEAPNADPVALEKKIEKNLEKKLGYEVGTFVRTEREIAAIAQHMPFTPEAIARATALHVAFTDTDLDAAHRRKVREFNDDVSDFDTHGREVYWCCSVRTSDSKFPSTKFEKLMGIRATWRNMNTVRRLADKYPVKEEKTK
ncbi:MAG TPA: DUF1697 domain-containing protein [Gemmatimonadaceae bacterium]